MRPVGKVERMRNRAHVLGMPGVTDVVMVPTGVAVSLLVGNIYYAFQARALVRRTGQSIATARS